MRDSRASAWRDSLWIDVRREQMTNFELITFSQWLARVDAELERRGFPTSDGCFDFSWRDCYDEEIEPNEAVEDAIEYWKEL
jgi:hypothetical protein